MEECQFPTSAPTEAPTAEPTRSPTPAPTDAPTSAPTSAPTFSPEERCLNDYAESDNFKRFCGVSPKGHCILNVYTAHDGGPNTCRRWCGLQGKQCIRAADNYGWPAHTCIVDTEPASWNADKDHSCDFEFWDQLCTCE